jgi:teichuronic acid biosynthesis glycosyltransferase TuaG
MPSFNSSKFIEEAIQSVIAQTFTEWELLITDDCSSDNTVEIIKKYAAHDSRIKLFTLQKNAGAAAARNVSIKNASGRFIAFLDSDDIWLPQKLEKQLAFMSEKKSAFSFSAYNIIRENGEKTGKKINVPAQISYHKYLKNTIIGCLTVMIDREKTGDFRMPLIQSSHDMALWLLVMKRGFTAFGLNEPLASYRIVSNSNTAKKWKAAKNVWRVYRDFEHLSILYSAFCFAGYTVNAILKRI